MKSTIYECSSHFYQAVILAAVVVVSFVVPCADGSATAPNVSLAEMMFARYNSFAASQDAAGVATLPTDESDDFCFISHGCWGGRPPQRQEQRDVAALIARLIDDAAGDPARRDERVRFVVAAGDNFYTEGVTDVYDERFFTTFESVYGGGSEAMRVPWLVALGNHDHEGNWLAQVMYTHAAREQDEYARRWASLPLNGSAVSGRWYMPSAYYALKVSRDMVVVVIDTVLLHKCRKNHADCWDGGKQEKVVEEWLLKTYAAVPHKVVVGHHPVLANGPHSNPAWLKSWLIPLMARSCASIYIHAHNHYLQVSKDGFQYYANSGGGAGSGLHVPTGHNQWLQGESIFHSIDSGVMLHCKKGKQLTHRVLNRTGGEMFRFVSWESEDLLSRQKCLAQLANQNITHVPKNSPSLTSMWIPFLLIPLLFFLVLKGRRRCGYHLRKRRLL